MRILHLTDFHFQSSIKFQYDQNQLIEALILKLKTENPINILIFSGDLVQAGGIEDDFYKAKEVLLDKIVNELSIPKGHVFISGGNHDVFRGQELEPITDVIEEFKSNEDIEKFLKQQDGKSYKLSLSNLQNYLTFEKLFYTDYASVELTSKFSDLYNIHFFNFGGKKIGIASINTAWRAMDSKTDSGSLLFPISQLKTLINDLKQNTDFRIAILHHPISDFKYFNAVEIENLIHNEFHVLFSGHVHERKQSLHICSDEGILCCFSPATLSLEKESKIGYSIVEVDLETFAIKIESRKFDKVERIFYDLPVISDLSIPVNAEKRGQNAFRETLRKKLEQTIKRANDLFVSNNESNGKGFIDLFTDPVIKTKTKAQIAEQKADTQKLKLSSISVASENYVIYGKDKCGKTSILYKVQLDLLKDVNIYKILPLYIDCKELRTSANDIDFYNLLGNFYELNKKQSEELPEKFVIKLLLDNYNPSYEAFNTTIDEFLNKHKSVTFIATTEETLLTSFDRYKFDGREYKNLFIHDISRVEVRSLANKWPNLTSAKKELILDKIFKILAQLNVPANFWTVSLFIWVFEKNQEANIRNNFELIQYYIDDLLDKDKLILDKSLKIEFEDFKVYLSQLSYFLITTHKEQGYTATYSEIVTFTERYIEDNKRFVITVENLLEILVDKGILRKNSLNRYTVRLTGVFEYFIAYYMRDNEEFRNGVIADDHYYLSFSNELELCAGFNRRDSDYVTKIFNKTKYIFSTAIEDYSKSPADTTLESNFIVDIQAQLNNLTEQIKGALPQDIQDEQLSSMQPENKQTEVTPKQFYESIESTAVNLEKALFILCRVFRNSSVLDDKLNDQILDYILDATCTTGFLLIDEVKLENEPQGDETNEKLMSLLMSTFMPLIVQTFLYDSLAQNNLERIILDKIEDLKSGNSRSNQFKLLLLYFTLIDLDIKHYKDLITEVMDYVRIGVLKQTILVKLYTYLLFKCTPNTPIEDFIKQKITDQTLKINNKADKSQIQKNLSRLTNSKRANKSY